MKAIVDRFASVRRGDPQRPLIHLPATNRTLTASDLDDRCQQYQHLLASLGIECGDLVLSASGNRTGTIPLLLACWTLGASVLPIDVGTPLAEALELAERFRASAVVVPASMGEGSSGARSMTSSRCFPGPAPPGVSRRGLLKLTSGSTGCPRPCHQEGNSWPTPST